MKILYQSAMGLCLLGLFACGTAAEKRSAPSTNLPVKKGTYAYDAGFLKKHTSGVVELASNDGAARILLSAEYQGRVMTSTAAGDTGISFGWLNYDLIASAKKKQQFNPVGGEERFWLGPEGGQYAIYFNQNDSFTINNWQVPPIIDTIAYDVVQSNSTEAAFSKKASLINYSGNKFDIHIERKVRMLDKTEVESQLHAAIPAAVKFVGYQTENKLQNIGTANWTKEKGLLSIWLLGMFSPTPKTMVIIPFAPVPDAKQFITDNYFGPIPADRLQVKDSVLFFVCDGKYRSKIGLSPRIARPVAAGFDFQNNVLTLVIPEIHKAAPYVNSKWELQKEPYKGDVINAYNDGPLPDGSQMGPFYEIESSSPALQLKKGEAATYKQATIHMQGDYPSLRQLAKSILGVDLDAVKK